MSNDLWLVLVTAAAFLGGIVAALLGWARSSEPFDGRKFIGSVALSLLAAVGVALAYQFGPTPGFRDLLMTFGVGAGIENLGQRAVGACQSFSK